MAGVCFMVSVGCTRVVCVLLFLGRWVGVEHPTMGDGIFSCLARPRLDCCTRSQIRDGALRARTGSRGKEDEAVSLEEFFSNPFSLSECEAGGVWVLEAIEAGSGQALIE